MGFRVLLAGGTGQVGSALVEALLQTSGCAEVVMVNRRLVDPLVDRSADPFVDLSAVQRVRQVVMDTGAADFAAGIADLAASLVGEGQPLFAASCIGIGKGSRQWSDEDMRKLELGVVGGFARGCLAGGVERFGLLSAAGSSAGSPIRYARIMGEKEDNLRAVGFRRLAMFRPGIIAGNVHTPGWVAMLGRLLPGGFGTIDQKDIARAFIGEFLQGQDGVTILENRAMRARSHTLGDV